ncbi:hypothetical protein G7048_27365 (plasmid) [Diaphorobacter sp. HDW4B]|uniref:hypothetical protein n=1 Tax=Diaphorobacter sp. HDW4B TaxID=2714925 RepID=UPI001408970B|nr:hypothetical protein [Diaphorobacter sp. HDW4B]QIL74197.1 hypothetical protein G7048_27365 [Diaphorobacter sp. HDW4B]
MTVAQLKASRDPVTQQTYIPPRPLVGDGSLREAEMVTVPAQGVLFACTTFQNELYGIVDLDCGSRIQTLLAPGTERIGERVTAHSVDEKGQARFGHE